MKILGKNAEYFPLVLGRTNYASSTSFISTFIYAKSHFVIRSQIGNIAALYRNEMDHASRKNAPALPKRFGYVGRLNNQGITLAELAA